MKTFNDGNRYIKGWFPRSRFPIHDTRAESPPSSGSGNNASISSTDVVCGNAVNTVRR